MIEILERKFYYFVPTKTNIILSFFYLQYIIIKCTRLHNNTDTCKPVFTSQSFLGLTGSCRQIFLIRKATQGVCFLCMGNEVCYVFEKDDFVETLSFLKGVGKITSLLSVSFRQLFIPMKWKNSGKYVC
jgi:hypothetical protein